MPTSPYSHMETFVAFLMQFRPRSILDIGLGNGKWGFLARDCLDVMLNESYHRSPLAGADRRHRGVSRTTSRITSGPSTTPSTSGMRST